jgi:hypothetical protein
MKGCSGCFLLAVALLGVAGWFIYSIGKPLAEVSRQRIQAEEENLTPEQRAERDAKEKERRRLSDLITGCEVKTRALIDSSLVSPASAKYTLQSGTTATKAIIIVQGHVDSANAFSAMLRNSVYAEFHAQTGAIRCLELDGKSLLR